jgi:C1A family cysteine protease
MKKLTEGVLVLLTGSALLVTVAGMDSTAVSAATKAWYDDIEVTDPYVSVTQTGDYVDMDDGEETPTVSGGLAKGLKGAASSALPSAYMNTLSQLTETYPSVRNQGDYNTCWAFSAAGLAEFDLITDNQTADSSIDLSELQIAYFTYNNQTDIFGGTAGDSLRPLTDYLQFGGNLDYASRALLQWQGVVNESLMSYTGILSSSKNYGSSYAFSNNVAHLQNAYIINIHTNQAALKSEIMKHGSAGISLYMSTTGEFYQDTVYEKAAELVTTYYYPGNIRGAQANHALNIVGWDDDFPAEAFTYTPQGNGAWLVRNSWSDSSTNSIDSYFWISYYDKGIEDEAWVFDFESPDNYDYNYQYDGCSAVYGINYLLCSSSSGNRLDITKYANVFKVQGSSNELLKAVSLTLNEDTNVSYKIRIYTNLTDTSNPASGVLAETVRGVTTYAGTYTIPLTTELSLPNGTYYSVLVDLDSAGNGIGTEFSYDYRGSGVNLVSSAYAAKNESFIYYNKKWCDLSEISGIGNLCIKGYTSDAGTSIAKTAGVKKSTVKKTSAKLAWTKTTGAAGYEIYRSTKKTGTYTKVATVKKCSYTNTGLKKNTTYYYKVRAYTMSGSTKIYGKFSGALKVTTKKK